MRHDHVRRAAVPAAVVSERRKHVRKTVLLPCRVDGVTTSGTLQMLDLSGGGCFVATKETVVASASVTVHARLGTVDVPLTGRIVHCQRGRGFAVEFENLSDASRTQLDAFLKRPS